MYGPGVARFEMVVYGCVISQTLLLLLAVSTPMLLAVFGALPQLRFCILGLFLRAPNFGTEGAFSMCVRV